MSTIDTVAHEHFHDPVAAYDRLAAHYSDLSRRRELYLRTVEHEITSRIPKPSRSLLDVGAGDGTRALHIAAQSGIERIVLVEPSKRMAAGSVDRAEVWTVRAEDLVSRCFPSAEGNHWVCGPDEDVGPYAISERFDVITCLWNVLGHIPSGKKRQLAFSAIARHLAPHGRFFLDVNHRYNLRSYGVLPTGARWIHDLFSRGDNSGDVLAQWETLEVSISTYGHVFTHGEIMRLASTAGLQLEERVVIDYESGRKRRFAFQGSLLYIFRRSS